MKNRIAVIAGDGIGKEVIGEALKVLEILQTGLEPHTFDYGADYFLKTGITIPDEKFDDFRENYDAILMGAFGDPRVPTNEHAKDILLGARFKLDLYINHRPITLLDETLCPLKNKKVKDVDFTVFRENTEGVYVGVGGIFKKGTPDEVALQQEVNTRKGVERIIRYAFEFARQRGLASVTMADKSNAMTYGHDLWRRCFSEISKEYSEIEDRHFYIDALVMEMIRAPEAFDVIVTNNLFGDIITDLGAQLQGGMGLAASGNLNPEHISMFEPVHGSAPDIAGKNLANPLAAFLTLEMMLRHLGLQKEAERVANGVREAVKNRKFTPELGGKMSTTQVGDYVRSVVAEGPV